MPKIIFFFFFIESDSLEFTMREYQSGNSFQNKVACAHLMKRCTMMMMMMMIIVIIIINSIPNPNLMNWDGV